MRQYSPPFSPPRPGLSIPMPASAWPRPRGLPSPDMRITIPAAKPEFPDDPDGQFFYIQTPDLPATGETLRIHCLPYTYQAPDEDIYYLFIQDDPPVLGRDGAVGRFVAAQSDGTPDLVSFNLAFNDVPKTDGLYRLWVVCQGLTDNEYDALPYWLILDYTPPGGRELPLILFADYPTGRATVLDILAAGGLLRGSVAAYKWQVPDDKVTGMFRNVSPPGEWITIDPVLVVDARETIILDFPLEALLAANLEGMVEFRYIAVDKALNPAESASTYMHLLMRSLPSGLRAPVFTETAPDGVIYEEQARRSMTISVPAYANAASGDVIHVWIDEFRWILGPLVAADVDDPSNPGNPRNPIVKRLLSYEDIRAIVDRFSGAAQAGTAVARYTVIRFDEFEFASPVTNQRINLILPPGPDPEPGTPGHEAIRPLVARGPTSDEDNVIPAADILLSTATLRWESARDGVPIYRDFDLVEIHELTDDGTDLGRVTTRISITDEKRDTVLRIDSRPDNATGVTWFQPWVGRLVAPGVINFAMGPVTRVVYLAQNDIPGGGRLLPEVSFRNALNRDTRPALNLQRGRSGALIRIYIDEKNIRSGDFFEVTVYYNQRTSGGVFDPLTGNNADDLGTPDVFRHTIEPRDLQPKDDWIPEDGGSPPGADRYFFDIRVPYVTLINRIIGASNGQKGYGSLWATYSVRREGKDYPSVPRYRPGTPPRIIKHLIVDIRTPPALSSTTLGQRYPARPGWPPAIIDGLACFFFQRHGARHG